MRIGSIEDAINIMKFARATMQHAHDILASYIHKSKWLEEENAALTKKIDQLHVQLAGCGVAALGATSEVHRAKRGMYGWSASYQDVLNLRLKYDRVVEALREIRDRNPRVGESQMHSNFVRSLAASALR